MVQRDSKEELPFEACERRESRSRRRFFRPCLGLFNVGELLELTNASDPSRDRDAVGKAAIGTGVAVDDLANPDAGAGRILPFPSSIPHQELLFVSQYLSERSLQSNVDRLKLHSSAASRKRPLHHHIRIAAVHLRYGLLVR